MHPPCVPACASNPCFEGVPCHDDSRGGFQCGACPSGYHGDGITCRPRVTCADRPCFTNVTCVGMDKLPGYRCGSCPVGFTGDGVRCNYIDECQMYNPCDPRVNCHNTQPGFRCNECPAGFHGATVYGIGIEQARTLRQVDNLLLISSVVNSTCFRSALMSTNAMMEEMEAV